MDLSVMISHASMDAKIGTAWQRLLKRVFPESKLRYSSDPRDPAFSGYGAFASEILGWIEQSSYILTVQTPDPWSYYRRNLRTKILKPAGLLQPFIRMPVKLSTIPISLISCSLGRPTYWPHTRGSKIRNVRNCPSPRIGMRITLSSCHSAQPQPTQFP